MLCVGKPMLLTAALIAAMAGCAEPEPAMWQPTELHGVLGFRSGVWGASADDVFVVGGDPAGQVHHFDGASWSAMELPPGTPMLIWVFGTGSDDVYAVGMDGAFLHYDGAQWRAIDSGTQADLWGVWGSGPDEMWLVGGEIDSGDPVILRYDGQTTERFAIAPTDNPGGVHALFKVWGTGDVVYAVGQQGLILEWTGSAWRQVPAGDQADQDFISLWGTSADDIVVVGGRGTSRLAYRAGDGFETVVPTEMGGINASFMCDEGQAWVGGIPGYLGIYQHDTGTIAEEYLTSGDIHAVWSDCAGTVFAVGGAFVGGDPSPGVVVGKY